VVTLFAFVAGISAVGVSHQVVWLFRDEGPMFDSSFRPLVLQTNSRSNLRQVSVGVWNYAKQTTTLPSGTIEGKHGRLLHGWQAMLLPHIEHAGLYEQIDFNAPWNDLKNRKVFQSNVREYGSEPAVFGVPPDDGYAPSIFSANARVMGSTRPMKPDEITDGTSQTILAGEVVGKLPAWGHPTNWRDPATGLDGGPAQFGSPWKEVVNFSYADGSVQAISRSIDPRVLRALSTPASGDGKEFQPESVPGDK
jgi:hypothetical protein